MNKDDLLKMILNGEIEFYTAGQAAKIVNKKLRIKRNKSIIFHFMERGKLKYFNVGKFRITTKEWLDEFIKYYRKLLKFKNE